ncbi:MAG: pseudaminic acid biosynthesis-associated methylase [Patescibacteria group bacterium]
MVQHNTHQQSFWSGSFGQGYNDRNTWTLKGFDQFYRKTWGTTRTAMNRSFLRGLKINTTLEMGANIGLQLRHLQAMGIKNLYGVELQWDAVERAKQLTHGISIIQGSAFDLPFKNNYFDLVFTSGVLIHIHPRDQKKAMREMYRVSNKYIWGFEYFNPTEQEIPYRGNRNVLWKNNFLKLWQKNCPGLKLVKMKKFRYVGQTNEDVMYLFKK